MYDLLEQRNRPGLLPPRLVRHSHRLGRPHAQSMARLTPEFSANRAVRQYTEQYYLPAATAYRASHRGQRGPGPHHRRGPTAAGENGTPPAFALTVNTAGQEQAFAIQVYLGELNAENIRIELFANGIAGDPPIRIRCGGAAAGRVNQRLHLPHHIPANRPASDYTPRMVPHVDGIAVPLELGLIRWQR